MGMGFFRGDKNVLKFDSGDCCIALPIKKKKTKTLNSIL